MTKTTHGGTRTGAGAPKKPEPALQRTIRLSNTDWQKFKSIGGAKWLREQLSKSLD